MNNNGAGCRITKLWGDEESRLAKQPAGTEPLRSGADAQRLIHDREVHPVELELQNEPLRQAGAEVDAAYEEFEDLEDQYQNAPYGYHSLDARGVFVRINDTELRWLGYSRDEVIGKLKLADLLPAASRPIFAIFGEMLRKTIETGAARDVNLELIRKDGSLLPVLANASVIRDAQGRAVGTRSTLTDMTVARRLKHDLAKQARRTRELSHRLIAVQEEERRRLAAELHDSTSPNLYAVALNLSMIAADLAPSTSAELHSRLADTRALLKDTIAGIRHTCAALRPATLDYAGLVPALHGHAELFARRTGIAVEVSCTDPDRRLAPELESSLFRIAQEALTNAAKHAQPNAIRIELVHASGQTLLTLSDDGAGFDTKALGQSEHRPGLGLLSMRERAEFAGGKFNLESEPGKGTRISVEI